MKNLAKPVTGLSNTWKTVIGLTLLFFILKTLGHR